MEKEEVLDAVLRGVPVAHPRRRIWLGALASLTAATAVFLWIGPRRGSDDFTSRGTSALAPVRAFCGSDPSGDTCRVGEPLFFELRGEPPARYLAVYARRADGAVIWYFPDDAAGRSLDIAAHRSEHALDRQIELGPEHVAGRYTLTFLFSAQPLQREDMKALPTEAPGRSTQVVVIR
jgi:hypothetical protein